jgi:hypothetical protein
MAKLFHPLALVHRPVLFAAVNVLLFSLWSAPTCTAQGVTEPTVKKFFNGQQMLVTYREGEVLYGTYFTLEVHFCASGRYMTFGESRRRTILDNEQVNRFTEEGTWEITMLRGQTVLTYVSVSGVQNIINVNVAPNGRVSLGDGISVVRQGPAQCRR